MFQPGDFVFVKDSAEEDVNGYAWNYIKEHREAVVTRVNVYSDLSRPMPESEYHIVCAWDEEFEGGWDCWGKCPPKRGQIITAKHLDLCFEKSRQVVTVPNIKGYEDIE